MAAAEMDLKPRVQALDLSVPSHVRGEYRIELPPGMRIERLSEPVSVSSEFGTVQIEYTLSGNTLTAVYALRER